MREAGWLLNLISIKWITKASSLSQSAVFHFMLEKKKKAERVTELCVGCFLSAQISPPLDVVFHLIKWNSVRAAASGIWASQKITSYYRRLCAVVKIRGALGCFIGVVRCKGSCFMEEQNISPAANLCQVQDLTVMLFWVGIKGKLVVSLCFRCRNPSITPLNPGMHTERHILQEINTF